MLFSDGRCITKTPRIFRLFGSARGLAVRFDVRLLVRSSVRPCCFAAMPHALESSSVSSLFVVHYSSSFMRRVQPTQRIHQTTFSCSSPRLLFIAQTHIAFLMQYDWQISLFEHAESAWF